MKNLKKHVRLQHLFPLLALIVLLTNTLACALFPTPSEPKGNDSVEDTIPLDQTETSTNVEYTSNSTSDTTGEDGTGLTINLSEGGALPQAFMRPTMALGEPLSEEEIALILARLPALTPEEEDTTEFRLPDEVLPPPQPGETITDTFPLPPEDASPPTVEAGPLEVLRYSPEGEIPIAPFVNVTFNQPMVPLTTLKSLAQEDVPVQIAPELTGTWRWLGTKTLNFQYDSDKIDRLPMATEYTVIIPAGVKSATGNALEETIRFSFNTPPPTVTRTYPHSHTPQPLDPIFFVAFDQRIDSEAVLKTTQVTANGERINIKLVTEKEIAEDATITNLSENAGEARWLAFKAEEDLPKAANIAVTIGPGIPSAEGPLLTTSAQTYSFNTYTPLKIVDHDCTWYEKCPPLTPFYIEFNNPIDPESYDANTLSIEPEIPGASVNIFGNTLQIKGMTDGRTTYRVTVNGDIEDIFGQKLGQDETLKFKVGPAESIMVGPQKTFITLDPSASEPSLDLYIVNYNKLDVKIYAVEPSDWQEFKKYLQEFNYTDAEMEPPGDLVLDETQNIKTPDDVLTEVSVSLSDVMADNTGHYVIVAKPHRGLLEKDKYWETVNAWVQVTQIGLDAFVDNGEMVVWASDLGNGAPLSEVDIASDVSELAATTAEDGTVAIDLPTASATYLTAQKGDDLAMLPFSTSFWEEEGWHRRGESDTLRWYVLDDRQMYRPGEEVHVKGWIRRIESAEGGDVALVGDAVSSVNYAILGPQGNEYDNGQLKVNAYGGFDLAFTLPENANLGYASIQLIAQGSLSGLNYRDYYHQFQIQEFRRPEFEVTARNETTGPYFVGDSATVAVEAAYYAGGPLPNAETNWLVTSSATNYTPPNWSDFNFGTWTPWWYYYWGGYDQVEVEQGNNFASFTDATGNHYLKLDFEAADEPRPHSVLAQATVFDVNRQAWSGSTSLLVHPANLYVGIRTERYFVEQGEPLEIDLIVTDLDGNAVADRPIQVEAARLEWKYTGGRWQEEAAEVQECTIGSQEEPVSCKFETLVGGRYTITATITDSEGRTNQSTLTRWVSGGQRPPAREVEQETVTLIPDQENYQPGDIAEILVQSPISDGEAMLTLSRSGILSTERFTIEDGSATLEIPIAEEHIPNLHVQVDVVGSAPRTDNAGETTSTGSEGLQPELPSRPAYATGNLTLNIPPLERTLSLKVTPEEEKLAPGEETTLDIHLTDADGNPVPNAELVAVVVDEAILALTNYTLTDPISVFYQQRPTGFASWYSRASIILANPQTLAEEAQEEMRNMVADSVMNKGAVEEEAELMVESAPMPTQTLDSAAGEDKDAAEAISIREDFNPLATFAPETRTDGEGRASVEVTLPDNLTRYRVMVVAVDASGKQFGAAEASITARLPLMVRPSAPRFLNFGDQFELPVVIQNQTNDEMEVKVVAQTSNLTLTAEEGQLVTVPANDRVEVRFSAQAEMAGTARFQIAGVSGAYTDAALGELPVYTPATTEAFATYGVVDGEVAIAQPVAAPEGVFPQFGGLEVNTSSTALQALTDAVLYLVSYPYECSEQFASRILGVAALRDVLTAFEADGLPSAQEMESAVARDIAKLAMMQNRDGGFPYWRRGRESIPFNTIHVAHALQRAALKGFEVPDDMQEQLLYYLKDIESHYPYWYSQQTRWTLSSYALNVRNLMGDRDTAKARNLFNEAGVKNLSMESVGWLWGVLIDDPKSSDELEAIRVFVNNRVVETAGAANFTTYYDDQTYLLLSSNRRTDAILLDALIGDNPDSDLIPKVVNGLLAHRTKGRWGSTQENVFVLLALDRYFNAFEAQTPDFVARIWLGETYAGSHEYEGYSTERHETEIPMNYLMDTVAGETQDLIIDKEGTGRLYYRLGLKYAPTDLNLEPLDMGFVVLREYEAVDDPNDVSRDEEGVWHIKAGARVRVRITMVADNRRYHVALVDPLPAGLEIINPALAISGDVPQDPNDSTYRYGWWWWGTWYQHQNMRDERAEAFTSLLWDGVYNYSYVARATTPGTFVVPPAKAEEMYSPEVFGRSGSDWVVVEDSAPGAGD